MGGENKENSHANTTEVAKNLEETESAQTDEFVELDEQTLEILDDDALSNKEKKFVFHPKLAAAWERVLNESLKKDKNAELFDKYPRQGNCSISAPKLNSEIEASINEASKKRDKFFVADLKVCGASLSALGSGITMIFNSSVEEIDTKELLATLADAGKLMCDLHHQLIKARKAFLYPNLDKKAKTVLESSQTGEFLFGPELSHRIKSAKAIEKLSLTLKPQAPEKRPVFRASSNLNWRGPAAGGRAHSQAGSKNIGHRHSQQQKGQRGKHQLSQGRTQNFPLQVEQPPSQSQTRK